MENKSDLGEKQIIMRYQSLQQAYSAVYASLSFSCAILNLICVWMFSRKEFATNYFNLLRIHSVNSLILNLNDLIFYLWLDSSSSNWLYFAVETVLYTFGILLDILIVYERIKILNSNWKPALKFTLAKLVASSLAVSILSILLYVY